jgi:hypothetical protein
MATIGLNQQWFNTLVRYTEGLQTDAMRTADSAVNFLQETVRDKARDTPGWSELADDIEVWSADGKLWIGVRNTALISEASLLEYGDEESAPNPLLRTLTAEFRQTGEMMRNQMTADYGPGKLT